MTRGQRLLLWIVSVISLLALIKLTSEIRTAVWTLPPSMLVVLDLLLAAVAFLTAYKALAQ